MKWIKPQINDIKIKTKFLFFPLTLPNSNSKSTNNPPETRWLCRAKIKYVYTGSFLNTPVSGRGWISVEWVD